MFCPTQPQCWLLWVKQNPPGGYYKEISATRAKHREQTPNVKEAEL